MDVSARDKRALILGSIAIVLLLAYLLWPRAEVQTSVELVPAAQRPAAAPPAAPPAPIPVQTVSAAPAPAPAGAVPQGLTLTGITGAGAIFAFQDGSQRYIARGREVVPGLTLQGLSLRHVILATGTTTFRLGFGGAAIPVQAPAVQVTTVGAPPGSSVTVTTRPAPAPPQPPQYVRDMRR